MLEIIKYGYKSPLIKPRGIHFKKNQNKNIILPKIAIGIFSRHLFNYVAKKYNGIKVGYLKCANFEKDIYIIKYNDNVYTLFMAGVSAPMISSDIEELAVQGVKTFIIFGNCGVLDSTIEDCHIIIPNKAYREDGTSYHYIREINPVTVNPKYMTHFIKILNEYNVKYSIGATWTTDAFFRETKDKISYYKKLNVKTVEMETAAIACVCKKLKLDYFTFYYAADNLDSVKWERRSLSSNSNLGRKKKISLLALKLAEKLIK